MTGRSEDSNLPTAAAPEGAVRIFGDEPLTPEEMLNLFEYSRGDVTAICSSEGVFGYASPACRSTLGWDPVALIGRSLLDFVHPEDLAVVHAARRSVLSSPTPPRWPTASGDPAAASCGPNRSSSRRRTPVAPASTC